MRNKKHRTKKSDAFVYFLYMFGLFGSRQHPHFDHILRVDELF